MKGLSILILAAGAARRMNRAKMLLPFAESTILDTIISRAKEINPQRICLVTGFYHQEITEQITDLEIEILYNANWAKGMSASIITGIAYLRQELPKMDSVFILVADQPYISASILQEMIVLQEQSGKGIIAASYAGVIGTPVLFDKSYFSSLENLMGDKGARSILQKYPEDIATVNFPLGEIDIDTEDDYQKMKLNN